MNEAIPKDGKYLTLCVIGMKGSGKSTIMLNIINTHLKKYYDEIYLVSTTALLDDKFADLIKELEVDGHFFDHFNNAVIQQISDELKDTCDRYKGKKYKPRSLVILDDCISDLPKSTEKNSVFNRFFVGTRHLKCDLFLSTQSFKKLNTIIRDNTDIWVLHHTNNKRELKNLEDELNMKDGELRLYMETIEGDPHDNLTINFLSGKPVVVKNFKIPLMINNVSSDQC